MAWQELCCVECGGTLQIFEAMFGTDVNCPHCQATVHVPFPGPPVAPPPSGPVDPYDRISEDAKPIYWIVVMTLVIAGIVGFLVMFLAVRAMSG